MKHKILLFILILIFCAGLIGSAAVLLSGEKNTVSIISDGEIIRTVDLDTADDEIFQIEYGNSYNIIEIKDGAIFVREASCPDKTCVHMGALRSSLLPVICLPNHLVIKFSDRADEVDVVAR